ncbi:hypothetical protein E2C01_090129 [Portunus trituberculatus]|uniref:Uncharacterized protein n=1 Tax=Portunus trituberculatus TaxID=210409 RepID=A0A5B7JP95_PORTR|nr:hypothetical protein [Portunus trituberculatus]
MPCRAGKRNKPMYRRQLYTARRLGLGLRRWWWR